MSIIDDFASIRARMRGELKPQPKADPQCEPCEAQPTPTPAQGGPTPVRQPIQPMCYNCGDRPQWRHLPKRGKVACSNCQYEADSQNWAIEYKKLNP